MIRKLLLHPLPHSDESDSGYGLRLAEVNGVPTLKRLYAILGMTPSIAMVLGKRAVYEVASGRRSFSAEELSAATLKADDLAGTQLFTSATRFCPHCLSERGVWKTEWDMPLAIACAEHGIELQGACDACQIPVSYFAKRLLLKCACGRDFRRVAAQAAPDWTASLDAVFRPWAVPGASARSSNEKRKLDRSTSIVLRRLIWEARDDGSSYRYSPECKKLRVPPHSYPIVASLLAEWPAGLHRLLTRRASNWSKQERDDLAKLVRKSATPQVCKAIIEVLEQIGRLRSAAFSNQHPSNVTPPAPGLVTLESVRRALGIGGVFTDLMFAAGKMERATVTVDHRFKWVDERELSYALWLRYQMPRLSEAAKFLGCSTQLLGAILRDGWLKAVVDPRAPTLSRVRVRDMAEFIKQLRDRAQIGNGSQKRYVALTAIKLGSASFFSKWSRFMRQIWHGEVELFHFGQETRGLGNFAVLRAATTLREIKVRGATQSRRRSASSETRTCVSNVKRSAKRPTHLIKHAAADSDLPSMMWKGRPLMRIST